MFNIIPSESHQEITPNKMEIIECKSYMFYTHKYGDKVIITSGLYVFLVIAALVCLIFIFINDRDKSKVYLKVLLGISTLLMIIILCNLSTYWQYINQTPYMLITNVMVLLALLVFSIVALSLGGIIINNIIIFFITCIIFAFIAVIWSYIPIPQSDIYDWLVFNSQMITSIIVIVLCVLFLYYSYSFQIMFLLCKFCLEALYNWWHGVASS